MRSEREAPRSKEIAFDVGILCGIIGVYGGIPYVMLTGSGWLFLLLIPYLALTSWGARDKDGREYYHARMMDNST